MRLPTTSQLGLTVLSTSLLACSSDEPPAPADVRTALSNDLGYVLEQGQASLAATERLPSGSAFGFATFALARVEGSARLVAPVTRWLDAMSPSAGRDQTQSLDEEQSETDALIDELNAKLFIDANYLGDGVYRVPASLVCEDSETLAIDPDCAHQLDQAELRVRVAPESDGLRFYVQIDANHDEPLAIFLSHSKLAVTVNLDDATDAMRALAPLVGESAPNADLSGQVTGAIEIKGPAHAAVSLTFDRALSIKFADDGIDLDSDAATRLASAAGDIVAVDLDASAHHASFDLGLGATTAHIPGDALDPAATDVALGGATVNASFADSVLTLENISLGTTTTTVRRGGALGLSIDLNPSDGRALDATVTVDAATGDEVVTVSPKLDLRTTVDHAVLGEDAPVYDVTHVLFDGALRGSELDSTVEVLAGSLVVETSPSEYGFSAVAGQCVTSTEVYDDVTLQSYETYAVAACQ